MKAKQTLLQWYRSLSAEDKEKCKRYWAKAKNKGAQASDGSIVNVLRGEMQLKAG